MLYIFDFDRTITLDHTCKLPETQIPRLADVQLFKAVIAGLRNSHLVAIASYGRKRIILETMKSIFPEDNPFTEWNVITPVDISPNWRECYEPPDEYDKNDMINLLRSRFQPRPDPIHQYDTILIDDSYMNVMKAYSNQCGGIWVNGHGFSVITFPQLFPIFDSGCLDLDWRQNSNYLVTPLNSSNEESNTSRSNSSNSSIEEPTLDNTGNIGNKESTDNTDNKESRQTREISPRVNEGSEPGVADISLFGRIWESFLKMHLAAK